LRAPVTVLAAKGNVPGHNLSATLHLADGCLRSKLLPKTAAPEEAAGVAGWRRVLPAASRRP